MISYLVEQLHGVTQKAVNFDKLKDTTQNRDECSTQFMAPLCTALRQFTEKPEGSLILKMYFITQSAPDIHKNKTSETRGSSSNLTAGAHQFGLQSL